MEFGISTRCFQSEPLTPVLLERLRVAEFTRIEIFAGSGFDYRDHGFTRSICGWFHENAGLSSSLHLPFEEDTGYGKKRPLALLDPEWRGREQAMDQIKRCLELVERLPVEYVVLHVGRPGENFSPVKFDFAYAALAAIHAFAGVHVLLENIPNEVATIDRLLEFKSVAQLAEVGICYDSGHGHLEKAKLEPHLVNAVEAMHIHDNGGAEDEHSWPFDGTIDWPAFVEVLTLSKFQGPLIFEPGDARIGKAQECRDRLNELFYQAANSIDEFRLKHKLPSRKRENE